MFYPGPSDCTTCQYCACASDDRKTYLIENRNKIVGIFFGYFFVGRYIQIRISQN